MINFSNGWAIEQDSFEAARQHYNETVFTIGNGYFGTRGVLEEGYPNEERSTFIHGIFDDVPVVVSELANIPDWMDLQILLAGERFSLAEGKILSFQRRLDLATATLRREVRWLSPKGRSTRLVFARFASLADTHLAGIKLEITPEDYQGAVEVHAGLDSGADNQGYKHWTAVAQKMSGQQAWLHCRTRKSGSELAIGISLNLSAKIPALYRQWNVDGHPTLMARCQAVQGETVSLQKWAVVTTSRENKKPQVEVQRRLRGLQDLSWDEAWRAHCQAWQTEWERCDVIIEGDAEAQAAVRFNLFQLLVAAPRHDERVNIGAKTLSGYGYRGHSFWDTEIFMLPFFTYTRPEIASNLLSYRWHNLPGARAKASANQFSGAQYPWESAGSGLEVTPTWVPYFADPSRLVRIWTGDIEIHISADIAYAVWQYWQATGDDEFMAWRGAEIILDTARFWASRVEWKPERNRYEISNVIGPDENHDHVDNNAYTNLLTRWHMQTALKLVQWLEEKYPNAWRKYQRNLHLSASELKFWQKVINQIYIPYDPATGLIEQFDGYFEREDIDMKALEPRTQSVQGLLGIEGANEVQVLKQPDVLMLLYLLPDLYDQKVLQTNYDYYTPRTDHTFGSSLGPSIQAIVSCKVGNPDAAYENFMIAARADLFDVRGNAGDGIHGASAGGLWQAVVFGFAGLHREGEVWKTQANLPRHWKRVAFKIVSRGETLNFEVKNEQ
jgi:trehalose/maltose hydrolase-like predicted phosphorylase